MDRKIELHKIVSYLGALLYIVLGFLTIGSIINETSGLYINLIMGILFITIGYYLYSRAKSVIELMVSIENLSSGEQVFLNAIARFLLFEKIFIFISLLLGIILLSAAILRVFWENLAIFG